MLFGPKKPDFDLSSELEFEEYAPQLRQQAPRLRPDTDVVACEEKIVTVENRAGENPFRMARERYSGSPGKATEPLPRRSSPALCAESL